jgi:serpin B
MKMGTFGPVSLLMILVFLGLIGCNWTTLFGSGDSEIQLAQSALPRDTSPHVSAQDLAELTSGNTEFALDLYQVLRSEPKNVFYSPISISLALAMTYGGARGATESQMAGALHFTLPQERLHPAFDALDLGLTQSSNDSGSFQLKIADSTWGEKNHTFLAPYLDLLAKNYGAGMRLLDFMNAPEPSRLIINQWVLDQTNGKIKDLLPPGSITMQTALVLTNAIYFKADWLNPFNPDSTHDGAFTQLGGAQVNVPMMTQDSSFGYWKGDDVEAVSLPYKGESTSMIILLPKLESFAAFENSLSAAKLSEMLTNLQPTFMILTLPKFSYSAEYGLSAALKELGISDAFTDAADLSGMDGKRDLFISDVVHKAFVAVDEKGTEAAAATGVIVGTTALPAMELRVDHPFIYLIRDNKTGTILFMGRVLNPQN